MFENDVLKSEMKTSAHLSAESIITAEWNMNHHNNLNAIGVYRYGKDIPLSTRYYDSDSSIIDGKLFNRDNIFETIGSDEYSYEYNEQKKLDLYYSLIDCIRPNRPRSGINKILWRKGNYVDDVWNAERPRYYYASPDDDFKYWTSYRNYGNGLETGISDDLGYIENAVPFITYQNAVPANRIVVKMQTNYGSTVSGATTNNDPLSSITNASVPKNWKIEYLNELDEWVTAFTFPEDINDPPIDPDGYVEISYGVLPPEDYKDRFVLRGYKLKEAALPAEGVVIGEAYITDSDIKRPGSLFIWSGKEDGWVNYPLRFGFKRHSDPYDFSNVVKQPVNPRGYKESGKTIYHEFVMVKGLRIVVSTMLNPKKTFDLIELSPRLVVSMADMTESYDITKSAAFDDEAMPVGGLIASNGSISLFNGDGAFSQTNTLNEFTGSIIADQLYPGTKFSFYELYVVDSEYIGLPIKTMYVELWPDAITPDSSMSLTLRDALFLLETKQCPEMLRRNMTLTGAVAWLLDSAGFSNYVFRGFESGTADPILPFFFTNKDFNIAQTLDELSKATQSMMYFDEYNNFVIASKEYLFDNDVESDFVFTGSDTDEYLANIESLDSAPRKFFNDGTISYTDRYIQRSPRTLTQAGMYDRFREYIYKPVLLWEVTGTDNTKTINEASSQQQGYALTAMALAKNLSADLPVVVNGTIQNNIIDVGENVYWVARYNGYLFANGEIIQYDAVEFSVPGQNPSTVWVRDNTEYQYYFSRVPFGGRMFPTGNIRIFVEPFYEGNSYKEGAVKDHGRGKFNTPVVEHLAGLSTYWQEALTNDNFSILKTESRFIFNPYQYDAEQYKDFELDFSVAQNDPTLGVIPKNGATGYSIGSTIKNMWAEWYKVEKGSGDTDPGAIQASALCFNGLSQPYSNTLLRDTMLITTKPQNGASFVGARVRIIGKEENGLDGKVGTTVSPFSYDFKTGEGSQSFLSGGSTGICAYYNKALKTGYFFEIISFNSDTKEMIIDEQNTYDNVTITADLTSEDTAINVTPSNRAKILPGYTVSNEHIPEGTVVSELTNTGVILSNAPTATLQDEVIVFKKYAELQAKAVNTVIFYKLVPGTVTTNSKYTASVTGTTMTVTTVESGSIRVGQQVTLVKYNQTYNTVVREFLQGATGKSGSYRIDSIGTDLTDALATATDIYNGLVPMKLWGSLAQILIDQGIFVGQSRSAISSTPTVYDLGIEYVPDSGNFPKFNLFINGKLVAMVEDTDADAATVMTGTNAGMFVRGSTNAMFENIILIKPNSINATGSMATDIFGDALLYPKNNKMHNYQISPFLKAAIGGISTQNYGNYTIEYEEFGTILRECAHFNVKYDQAFPAFYSKIAPNINDAPAYFISNYRGNPYSAEFMVFNITDKAVKLDETTGNYLRILGVTFTQATTHSLTVDEYVDKYIGNNAKINNELLASRREFGTKTFTLDNMYIQNQDMAKSLLEWMLNKLKTPRLNVSAKVFPIPTLQLGDIVTFNYKDSTGTYIDNTKQMLVTNIQYSRDSNGPNMTVTAVER